MRLWKRQKPSSKIEIDFPSIDPARNYKRLSNGDILSGKDVLHMLKLVPPIGQCMILLDIWETNDEPTKSLSETPQKPSGRS